MKPNDNYPIYDIEAVKSAIFNKSMPEPNTGCWIWMGDSVKGGYGRFHLSERNKSRKWLSHRISYKVFKGEIPDGHTIDHLCKNTHCCNPSHLEAVTMKENTYRGNSFSRINKDKTHCKNGHQFTVDNTYRYNDGRRDCLTCIKVRERNRYLKLKSIKNGNEFRTRAV